MRALLFFLLVLVFFGLIMFAANRIRGWLASHDTDETDTPRAAGKKLVKCVACGAYLPESQAIETKKGPSCPHH